MPGWSSKAVSRDAAPVCRIRDWHGSGPLQRVERFAGCVRIAWEARALRPASILLLYQEQLLRQIAASTGGRYNPRPADVFDSAGRALCKRFSSSHPIRSSGTDDSSRFV